MRRGTKYFCGICVIIAIFAVSNYIFYKSALRHFEQMQIRVRRKHMRNLKLMFQKR